MVSASVKTTGREPVPAIFIIHVESAQTVVVADWPHWGEKATRGQAVFDTGR